MKNRISVLARRFPPAIRDVFVLEERVPVYRTRDQGAQPDHELNQGDTITVEGSFTEAGKKWTRITLGENANADENDRYVEGDIDVWTTDHVVFEGDELRLHAKPSVESANESVVKRGTKLSVLGMVQDRGLQWWFKIRPPSGESRFVPAESITISPKQSPWRVFEWVVVIPIIIISVVQIIKALQKGHSLAEIGIFAGTIFGLLTYMNLPRPLVLTHRSPGSTGTAEAESFTEEARPPSVATPSSPQPIANDDSSTQNANAASGVSFSTIVFVIIGIIVVLKILYAVSR